MLFIVDSKKETLKLEITTDDSSIRKISYDRYKIKVKEGVYKLEVFTEDTLGNVRSEELTINNIDSYGYTNINKDETKTKQLMVIKDIKTDKRYLIFGQKDIYDMYKKDYHNYIVK